MRPRLPAAILGAVLSSLLLAACGSTTDGGSRSESESPREAAAEAAPAGDVSALPATGVKAGWIDPRSGGKSRQISLTLISASSQEGRLISTGRARMDGGKVVDDKTAGDILQAFDKAGFDRFAVMAKPEDAPSSTLGVIWIDRGRGIESLFFLPGARQDPRTADLPDVYDSLKKFILYIHQSSPGSMVTAGEGWSGDQMTDQKVEKKR